MALQMTQQRLAYDPKKRLTAGYEEAVRVRLRNQLPDLVFWMMGALWGVTWTKALSILQGRASHPDHLDMNGPRGR